MNIEIKDLNVDVENKKVLQDFNLKIKPGEIHAIMGPNGTGKSTLSKVIMGYPDYKIVSGDILVNQESILNLEIDERSKLGIFLVYQNPIEISGLTNSEVIKASLDSPMGIINNYYAMELVNSKSIEERIKEVS